MKSSSYDKKVKITIHCLNITYYTLTMNIIFRGFVFWGFLVRQPSSTDAHVNGSICTKM